VSDDDHELRSRLERLASSAGDPPEHGLERIAARRHRRLHRRRGAVATAAVLAVLIATLPLLTSKRSDHDAVTASESVTPAGVPVEVPNTIEVRCEPTGIVVPVASVRPQRDGLHIRVVNSLPGPTSVAVGDTTGWSSGPITVETGMKDVRVPVPPGVLSIGCDIAGVQDRRQVNLVDTPGYYETPTLACDEGEQVVVNNLPIEPATASITDAVRVGLAAYDPSGDGLTAPRGYPSARLGDPTDDPVVAVTRDHDVVAFAHVRGAGGSTSAPWTTIVKLQACSTRFAPDASVAGTTTTTTTPAGPSPPA
jgi:hypothetical protein